MNQRERRQRQRRRQRWLWRGKRQRTVGRMVGIDEEDDSSERDDVTVVRKTA
jgi:hypothetical protein